MNLEPPPGLATDLTLTPVVIAMIERAALPGRHSARSALHHLNRAWEIRAVDPEMAVFRSITAEEESATAIFHALQHRKYPGAQQIDWRRHLHKAALLPFLEAVGQCVFGAAKQLGLQPELSGSLTDPQGKLAVRLAPLDDPNSTARWEPQPPLGFFVTKDGRPHDFREELEELTTLRNVETLKVHIKERANRRNRLLYAGRDGVPSVDQQRTRIDNMIKSAWVRTMAFVQIFLLIDQHEATQQFVTQALAAFLSVLSQVDRRRARTS